MSKNPYHCQPFKSNGFFGLDLAGKLKSIAFSHQIVYDKLIIVLVDYRETGKVALQKPIYNMFAVDLYDLKLAKLY